MVPPIIGNRHRAVSSFDFGVHRQVERGLRDHAKPAVATDRAGKYVGVHRGTGVNLGAIGEHNLDRSDRQVDWPLTDVAAVHVH